MNPGFSIRADFSTMEFLYGDDVFGPPTEKRFLRDVRASLRDPDCEGPELLYSVAMDVGKEKDREDLIRRNLLYGAMIYTKGRVGKEPVRSQGHAHAVSASCGCSTPEVYEIWSGRAVIYMQESGDDDAGDCYAVEAAAGDVVIVPEGWVHCTVNASEEEEMTFGAWCVRDYGFDYREVRAHGGVAFFPVFDGCGGLDWEKNPAYTGGELHIVRAADYSAIGIRPGVPIYQQYEENPALFDFVKDPMSFPKKSESYISILKETGAKK